MSKEYRVLEPLDWRYAAAMTGLSEYLTWLGDQAPDWEKKDDYLRYDPGYINEHDYLGFVEYKYCQDMHHKVIEDILKEENPSDDQIKLVNEKLSANVVMKKVFQKIKFDGKNRNSIQDLINENRDEIIRETYRNKNNLYRNFCNTNQLFEDSKDCCRLLGYYVDMPKKGKSLGYNFNISNFDGTDEQIFDFIPFAFHGEREFFFVNDNIKIENLIHTNAVLASKMERERQKAEEEKKQVDARRVFFKLLIETRDFVRNDVEVIIKDVEKTHFETLYLRRESLDILKSLGKQESGKSRYECFCFKIKITDNYWLDIFQKVTDAIVNLVLLDDVIDYLLKNNKEGSYTYVIRQLIRLNILIKGDKSMEQKTKMAFACAKAIAKKIPDNKLNSYRQKLTSALTFEDYDRFNIVLLNLMNYADEPLVFAYDLFEDFEKHKELAYTFVSSLRKTEKDA